MLARGDLRNLKADAVKLEGDRIPRSEVVGLYFKKHRPCWSVDYHTREGKRKTIEFFVPVSGTERRGRCLRDCCSGLDEKPCDHIVASAWSPGSPRHCGSPDGSSEANVDLRTELLGFPSCEQVTRLS